MTSVGFEPTPLARRGPEPRALDRSATMSQMSLVPKVSFLYGWGGPRAP